MANQRDVARVAGVSSATVSRFLARPELVSPRASDAIKRAIAELNYRLDPSAQALRMGKSRHIGVLCPGGGPFHWGIFSAAQSVFHQYGYFSTLYLTRADPLSEPDDPLEPLTHGRQIDGLLYIPTLHPAEDNAIERLQEWDCPVVIVDRPLSFAKLAQVYVDNYAAGRRAAREFLDRGHRDFLFIWGRSEFPSAQNRFAGFRDELKQAGITLSLDRQLEGEFFSLTAYEETKRRWPALPPFSAVFASNDSSALGFLKAAREHGKESPRDFSLIGFDDNYEFTLLYNPPLATFSQPADAMGRKAAEILLKLINQESPQQLAIALEASFISRDSLGGSRA